MATEPVQFPDIKDLPPGTKVDLVLHATVPSPVIEMVTLTRGQRGGVGWEIRAATVDRIKELDAELLKQYPPEPPPAKP